MAKEPNKVAPGKTVQIHYTLTVDGREVDSSNGGEPLVYEQGKGNIIPGLEHQLEGMSVGEKKHVIIGPDDAYGPVNPNAFVNVPVEKLPPEARQPGAVVTAPGEQGQTMRAMVVDVKDNQATLNFNHPLAGKELAFDVEVVDVN